jgi:hypothetical protein
MPFLSSIAGGSVRGYGFGRASAAVAVATNSYFPIASYTVPSGGQATVTFAGIPQTYSHLQLRMSTKDNTGLASQSIRINGDTGSNYAYHRLYGEGSTANASGVASVDLAIIGISSTQFGSTIMDFLDYRDTNKYKTIKSFSGFDNNGSGWVGFWSGLWMNTNAITSIKLQTGAGSQSWTEYSTFALYGVN